MGISSGKLVYARDRSCTGRRDDRGKAASDVRQGTGRWSRRWLATYLIAGLTICAATVVQAGDGVRISTLNIGFDRDGPGILLRDILQANDPQVLAGRDMIVVVKPDILLLTNFDYDLGLHALRAFADLLRQQGLDYPHLFAFAPNSGFATGLDMNGDGRLGTARDAQGFGEFPGQGGMAFLSRYLFDSANTRDFSNLLWRDFPNAIPPKAAQATQRLSSVGHWDVPVILPDGAVLRLLAYHATTPVFDGPEDFNGRRNHDENAFWLSYLDGALGSTPPSDRFVILGDANLDPADGEGRRQVISGLLTHRLLQDPKPTSRGAVEAGATQGGVNAIQIGNAALDTADWRDVDGPGNLRVDYVLPSRDLSVSDAGVYWPASDGSGWDILRNRDPAISWHGLVWVDVSW
jgi:hypothetical protein